MVMIINNKFKFKFIFKFLNEFKEVNEEGFIVSVIYIVKVLWKEFKIRMGLENILIEGNIIEGCYFGVFLIVF